MSAGLIYNACQLELADILMLENVTELQRFEALFTFLNIELLANSSSPMWRMGGLGVRMAVCVGGWEV